MPVSYQNIGATAPKTGSKQYNLKRLTGIPLVIPVAAGVTSITNRRIVSLQEDSGGNLYACVSQIAINGYTLIGWGVLEEALQSGGLASIAPDPNTFKDGDLVTVNRDPNAAYMVDIDESNAPTLGINTAYLDNQGRLSSVTTGNNLALQGAVYKSFPGMQMTGQLAALTRLYTPLSAVKP